MTAIPTTESSAADKEFPIPLSRFMTQAIFSALVTSVTTQLQTSGAQLKGTQGEIPEFMLGVVVFVVMALFSTVFHFITVDKFLSRDDGLYAADMNIQTIILGLNYHFVTDMGKLIYDFGFTLRQHLAVNFCLTFIIVSEIEFCYANEICRDSQEVSKYYRNSNQDCKNNAASSKDSGTNKKDSTTASITPTHVPPYTRDPFFYGYWIPPQGSDHPFSSRVISRLFFAQWLLFAIINGLLNVAAKRVVDPSWDGRKDIWLTLVGANVLFTTGNFWQLLLNLLLLRVVRQANHVVIGVAMRFVIWYMEIIAEAQKRGYVLIKKDSLRLTR